MHLVLDLFGASMAKAATREGWGKALMELGKENPNVVALSADVSGSVYTHLFEKEFPSRFIQCGVAEQNMARGMASAATVRLGMAPRVPRKSSV